MKVLLRGLLALLFGLFLIVPSPADNHGGGSGGVWILPFARVVTIGVVDIFRLPLSEARVHRRFDDVSKGVTMRMPDGMGDAIGTLHVPAAGVVGGVAVEDGLATISASRFDAFFRSGIRRLEVVFADTSGRCIPIVFLLDAQERAVDAYVY